ncbi:hypothetical protein STEG23_030908, partial [Scotinomys teguina]
NLDCSRKLKNVLVTIYWLGKAANSCTSYSGTTLNLKEFEGLLAQMRKETEDIESPKRSIRDSGYIDCWDSERSDSLSPPRHGRDDSFDSLDSFGSRSRQTPSPDVVLRGSSDGRGSDSESDLPHRKLPDVKKDDMSARRTSHGEPKSAVPFNQYLPNKSNQTAYVPAPLRKKKVEREEFRKSWSTATSPLGGERPFSYPETIEEEGSEGGSPGEDDPSSQMGPDGWPHGGLEPPPSHGEEQSPEDVAAVPTAVPEDRDAVESQKRRKLEQAGIKVMPAAQRFASQKQLSDENEATRDIILRKENPFLTQHGKDSESEDEVTCQLPDLEKDDFAARRARMNQSKPQVPLNQLLYGPYRKKDGEEAGSSQRVSKGPLVKKTLECKRDQDQPEEVNTVVACVMRTQESEPVETNFRRAPDLQKDDLAQRRIWGRQTPHREVPSFIKLSGITEADLETWERLKVSGKTRDEDAQNTCAPEPSPEINAETAIRDDFASRKARAYKKASSPRQKNCGFCQVQMEDTVQERLCQMTQSLNNWSFKEQDLVFQSDVGHTKVYGLTEMNLSSEGSTSMFDMRCEEEAAVLPHSRARQEQLQLINNQLREEDDKWQDDLARWKSRRRSASQDLIKKEEERKKMEKLMSGEDGASERRKSIKTYREIVQEKERRERELHEAYKNARSQEEAEGILQQYIERFTISEAVLERLEMPKILERSHSAEPNVSSLPNDPSPMKYLRQQSLPPPKFTATVETTIARTGVPETSAAGGSGSPSKTISPNAVPMLTPKPYSQPKNSQEVLKTFKVDGKISMNGEMGHGEEEEKEKGGPTAEPGPSPSLTKSQMFEGVATVHGSPVQVKQGSNSIEINIQKPDSTPQEPTLQLLNSNSSKATAQSSEQGRKSNLRRADMRTQNKARSASLECVLSSGTRAAFVYPVEAVTCTEPQHFTTTVTRCSPTVAFVEFSSIPQRKDGVPEEHNQKKPENDMSGRVELVLSQKVVKPKSPEPEATLTFPFLDKMPDTNQLHLPNLSSQAYGCVIVTFNPSTISPLSMDLKACTQHPHSRNTGYLVLLPIVPIARSDVYSEVPSSACVPLRVQNSWRRSQFFSQSADSPSSEKSPGTTPFKYWAWDPEEERRRQEKWQREQERLLQERYQKEQDKLKEEWAKAQKEVEEEERRYYEEERKIIEDTVVPFTLSSSSADQLSTSSSITEGSGTLNKMYLESCQDKEEERRQKPPFQENDSDSLLKARERGPPEEDRKCPRENFRPGPCPLFSYPPGQSPNRSISGKKLCSSCGLALGKGAAMIIETLNLYFHIQCFRCGICKGQLGDTVSGTDVRIRNGLLNCTDCYMRSRMTFHGVRFSGLKESTFR